MKRPALIGYSALAYVAFLASVLWAMGFFADILAPTLVDGRGGPVATAIAVDVGLLFVFALQHSVMARPAFKRAWRRLVPDQAQRSTYVLLASAILILVFWSWRPIPGTVWLIEGGLPATAAWTVYAAGWLVVVSSTFMVNHFDLFGLRQAYLFARARAYTAPGFKERWLYAWVRHPMMSGLLIVFWATPRMSVGHLVLALAATGYILIGTALEERDLRVDLGPAYRDYARRVPAFVPLRRMAVAASVRTFLHLGAPRRAIRG